MCSVPLDGVSQQYTGDLMERQKVFLDTCQQPASRVMASLIPADPVS